MILLRDRFQTYLIIIGILFLTVVACRQADEPLSPQPPEPDTTLAGLVSDGSDAISDAIVRIQTSSIHTVTDGQGQFRLNAVSAGDSVILTAWAPGYYIGGGTRFMPGDTYNRFCPGRIVCRNSEISGKSRKNLVSCSKRFLCIVLSYYTGDMQ